jgi:hypothetical protein
MTAHDPGYLIRIVDKLNAKLYCSILEDELQQTIQWYKLKREKIIFQHDNNSKYTVKKLLNGFKTTTLRC